MNNPFTDESVQASDEQLALQAQAGDRGALEQLALRHQPWIYNIAVRMVWSGDDAQDLTQDILVKMIAGLPSFRGESRFRTWLYRIAVNHIFTFKKQREEEPVETYKEFARDLDQTPDLDPLDPNSPATQVLIEEAKILCTVAMLLCLTGRQRGAPIPRHPGVVGSGSKRAWSRGPRAVLKARQLLSRCPSLRVQTSKEVKRERLWQYDLGFDMGVNDERDRQ